MDLAVAAAWNFVSQKRGLQPESRAFSPPPTIRPDSAGAGTFRGGFGTEKVVQVLAESGLSVQIDRTRCPLWGIRGGGDGMTTEASVEPADGSTRRILKRMDRLGAGDRFRLMTGGGGFGPPLGRDPARVADDVAAGYISVDHAADLYGVIVDENGNLDAEATAARREEIS